MHAVIAVPDLLFQSRIEAALRARGIAFEAPATQADAEAAAAGAQLVIVDLQGEGLDAPSLIRVGRSGGARVLAFGRHTAAAALRQAREAGADLVVPRSQLADELPDLLERLLASRAGYGAGTG